MFLRVLEPIPQGYLQITVYGKNISRKIHRRGESPMAKAQRSGKHFAVYVFEF